MTEEIKQEFKTKINFVSELEKTIISVQRNIKAIHYDIFVSTEHDYVVYEFLVIEYVGGAKSARNCAYNSCAAIFQELAKFLTTWNGGGDISSYNKLINSDIFFIMEV